MSGFVSGIAQESKILFKRVRKESRVERKRDGVCVPVLGSVERLLTAECYQNGFALLDAFGCTGLHDNCRHRFHGGLLIRPKKLNARKEIDDLIEQQSPHPAIMSLD